MKQWLTAKELAGMPGMPANKRSVARKAEAGAWRYREIQGNGGLRREYHLRSLPESVRQALISAQLDQMELPGVLPPPQPLATAQPFGTAQPLDTAHPQAAARLKDWQHARKDARAALLREVETLASALGAERAIREVVSRAQGGELPEHLARLVSVANARGGKDGKRTLSIRTLKRWRAAMKIGAAALAPKQPDRRETPLWAAPLLKTYRQPQKPALSEAVADLHAPGMLEPGVSPPSYSQAWRFIASLGEIEKRRGRMGPRELRNLKSFVRRDSSHMLPADCYTADGHTFDAEVAHPEHGRPFRPELVAVVDVATRRIVGWSVGLAESSITTLDALRHACQTCGVPAMLYTDNGSGYKNHLLTDEATGVLARLGTEFTTTIAYNSQAHGISEALNKYLWVPLAKKLPTYMGADMDPEAKKIAFRHTRATGRGLIAWEEFLSLARQAVEAKNSKGHSALPKVKDAITGKRRRQTPLEAWDAFVSQGWVPEVPADHALFFPRMMRTVRRCELRLPWGRYFSRDLEEWHNRPVHVAYDIHDGNRVSVYDPEGPLLASAERQANDQPYFPESRLEHAREQRRQGRLRRMENKAQEIEQEAGVPAPAEAVPPPLSAEDRALAAQLEARAHPITPKIVEPDGRPVFSGEFAERDWGRWVLAKWPDVDAAERQVLLRRCESPIYRELLGIGEAEVEALAI